MTPLDVLNLLELYVLIWTLPDKCPYWPQLCFVAAQLSLDEIDFTEVA
jgi:hypothetical protein